MFSKSNPFTETFGVGPDYLCRRQDLPKWVKALLKLEKIKNLKARVLIGDKDLSTTILRILTKTSPYPDPLLVFEDHTSLVPEGPAFYCVNQALKDRFKTPFDFALDIRYQTKVVLGPGIWPKKADHLLLCNDQIEHQFQLLWKPADITSAEKFYFSNLYDKEVINGDPSVVEP